MWLIRANIDVNSLLQDCGDYVIIGSGLMEAKGLRQSNDIDILVRPEVFDKLQTKYGARPGKSQSGSRMLYIGDIEIYDEQPGIDISALIAEAQVINGRRYPSDKHFLLYKQSRGEPKDLADIKMFKENNNGKTGKV